MKNRDDLITRKNERIRGVFLEFNPVCRIHEKSVLSLSIVVLLSGDAVIDRLKKVRKPTALFGSLS